jgi:hypothetical protein
MLLGLNLYIFGGFARAIDGICPLAKVKDSFAVRVPEDGDNILQALRL